MPTRTPRSSRGLFAVGIVFVVIGFSQGTAFLAVGVAFLAVALTRRRRDRDRLEPLPENVLVGSADEALVIARRFVEAEGAAERLQLETASATESDTDWRVAFERTETVIPPSSVVSVGKRDGVPTWVPMR